MWYPGLVSQEKWEMMILYITLSELIKLGYVALDSPS